MKKSFVPGDKVLILANNNGERAFPIMEGVVLEINTTSKMIPVRPIRKSPTTGQQYKVILYCLPENLAHKL